MTDRERVIRKLESLSKEQFEQFDQIMGEDMMLGDYVERIREGSSLIDLDRCMEVLRFPTQAERAVRSAENAAVAAWIAAVVSIISLLVSVVALYKTWEK